MWNWGLVVMASRLGHNTPIHVIMAIVLALLIAVVLDAAVPRQVLGFVTLSFIPGYLIIRLLKLHRRDMYEVLAFSVALSVAFDMLLGFFINLVFPLVGVGRPISALPVVSAVVGFALLCCAVLYLRKEQKDPTIRGFDWLQFLRPQALCLFLLPLLAVLGAVLVNAQESNVVLLILLSLIAFIFVLASFGKFISASWYQPTILATSLSLVWHASLISPDVIGYDIHAHVWLHDIILGTGRWNPASPGMPNAMLSVVLLSPIYSIVTELSGIMVYKVIYPLFLSLVPLLLFQAYRRQLGDKVSFFAAFFFMSFPAFFFTMTGIATMMIADLFLAVSIALLVQNDMAPAKKSFLLILFAFGLVTSHYGTSYVFMMYIIAAWLLALVWKLNIVSRGWKVLTSAFERVRSFWDAKLTDSSPPDGASQRGSFPSTYVMLFLVLGISWYIYVARSANLYTVVELGRHIYTSLSGEFLSIEARDPQVVQALTAGAMRANDMQWEIARIFQYATQLFIIIGGLVLLINMRRSRINPMFGSMVFVSFALIGIAIILPYFLAGFGMYRLYHLLLFVLAPFCILGGTEVFRFLHRSVRGRHYSKTNLTNYHGILVLFVLVPYFLFATGYVFELTGATPSSSSLALWRADTWSFFTRPEMRARSWAKDVVTDDIPIIADDHGRTQLFESFAGQATVTLDPQVVSSQSYVFLRRWNVNEGELLYHTGPDARSRYLNIGNETAFLTTFGYRGRIYDSGSAQIYGFR